MAQGRKTLTGFATDCKKFASFLDAARKSESDDDGAAFYFPPYHPNCLMGETPVFAPDKIAAFVAAYCGPVFEITVSNGARFTVTANHMFLTSQGFVPAQLLRKGANVFHSPVLQRISGGGGMCPDNDWRPSRIDEVVEAFAKTPGVTTAGVPAASENLHGDGRFVNGDIDIIAPDSLLRGDFESFFAEHGGKLPFPFADPGERAFTRESNATAFLFAAFSAARGGIGGKSVFDVIDFAPSTHHKPVGVCLPSDVDSVIHQNPSNMASAGLEFFRERIFRTSCNVFFDDYVQILFGKICSENKIDAVNKLAELYREHIDLVIVEKIKEQYVETFVYDLQTISSLYHVCGVVSSNCRCVPVIIDNNSKMGGGRLAIAAGADKNAGQLRTREDLEKILGKYEEPSDDNNWNGRWTGLSEQENFVYQTLLISLYKDNYFSKSLGVGRYTYTGRINDMAAASLKNTFVGGRDNPAAKRLMDLAKYHGLVSSQYDISHLAKISGNALKPLMESAASTAAGLPKIVAEAAGPAVAQVAPKIVKASVSEADALELYKGESQAINAVLRGQEIRGGFGMSDFMEFMDADSARDAILEIDSYFNRLPVTEFSSQWRGDNPTAASLLTKAGFLPHKGDDLLPLLPKVLKDKDMDEVASYLKDKLVGSTLSDKGYLSTTTDKNVAAANYGKDMRTGVGDQATGKLGDSPNVVFKIFGKSKGVSPVSVFDPDDVDIESEILLQRGLNFIVSTVTTDSFIDERGNSFLGIVIHLKIK
jgi:hypothetical protein